MMNSNTAPQNFQQMPPNFLFGQPQFSNTAQPQFFIAGPSPSNASGMPYQQILIPLNQPPMQQNMPGLSSAQGLTSGQVML